jgi:rhodanese-related sulfurtransferase
MTAISPETLDALIGTEHCPVILDVRRRAAFDEAERAIATASWRDHRETDVWAEHLAPDASVVVYCVHGHQVSQSAAALLRAGGWNAAFLEGGIEGFQEAGGATLLKEALPERGPGEASRWVTSEDPGLAPLACCWLIRRFVDPGARLLFATPEFAGPVAEELAAIPFALPEARFAGFEALVEGLGLDHQALERFVAAIAAADADLTTLVHGIKALHAKDRARLAPAFTLFDALYEGCRRAGGPS